MAQITLNSSGITSSGALALQSNGTTTAVTVDTSQNVGIGTTSPTARLHVQSTGGTVFNLKDNTASGGGYANIFFSSDTVNANGYLGYNNSTNAMNFGTGNTERARIDSSGNLMVGDTTASGRLTVKRSNDGNLAYFDGTTTQFRIDVSASTIFLNAQNGNGAMAFQTNGTERARIDSSGNLLVGQTAAGTIRGTSQLQVNNGTVLQSSDSFNGVPCVTIYSVTDTTNGRFASLTNSSGTEVGSITRSGTSSVAYNTSSDYRLKNITGALTGYKERLMSLLPKQGTWIADGSEFRGFVAHEFANPYRASVTGEKDAVDSEGNPIMQGMQASSSEVMADLVALVQEQQAIIESLKARLDAANL